MNTIVEQNPIRVRFAPSPTGALHIGGARTAYFNWLFARQQGGTMILRIDDTDTARSTEASYRQILTSFRWLGLDWDEGPEIGGAYGPYRQSERQSIYHAELERLKRESAVYPCFCSPEMLQADREAAQKAGLAPRYVGRCRHLSSEQVADKMSTGARPVYRLKSPTEGETVVHDLIRGDVSFSNREIDDFIVWKADGTPTYHFASCVDDAKMEISHIIRAEEHLSNTPRHIVLFNALGFSIPQFAHVPMILAPDRSKLSKRHGATSVEEYREAGILPEALMNYLLLLGFAPGENQELVTVSDAIAKFDLSRVTKHAAVYDVKKLEWLNAHYFRKQLVDVLLDKVWPELEQRGWVKSLSSETTFYEHLAWLRTVVAFTQERARNEQEMLEGMRYYFEDVMGYDSKGVAKHFANGDVVAGRLAEAVESLLKLNPFTSLVIEREYQSLIVKLGIKGGELIHPTRLAISGVTVGPGLFDVMAILGRDRCIARLQSAIVHLQTK